MNSHSACPFSFFVGHAACCAAMLFALGCGGADDGPPRFEVSGHVTYENKPVPTGEITFTPDSDKGNSGPGMVATIRNGEYKSAPGMGAVAGPHIVRISGQLASDIAGAPPAGAEDSGAGVLFREYRTTVNLPSDASSQDFEVPAETK